jgi:hypothetical protein
MTPLQIYHLRFSGFHTRFGSERSKKGASATTSRGSYPAFLYPLHFIPPSSFSLPFLPNPDLLYSRFFIPSSNSHVPPYERKESRSCASPGSDLNLPASPHTVIHPQPCQAHTPNPLVVRTSYCLCAVELVEVAVWQG